jgi:guanosine-3',5'-bis(diphosphate) 3'-pyrophosphohydrolase
MFAELIQRVLLYNPKADISFLNKAYNFAETAHAGQKRISGEPFILHPVAVARILADLELDLETMVASLLHDVVEDTQITLPQIESEFGPEVALLVDGVTKLSRLEIKSKEERQAENLRKMFLAMAKDIRVILIKLADRLHNLRTLQYQPKEKQKEIAEESLEIFSPLAHRLGIYHIKSELEDLAFHYVNPGESRRLSAQIASSKRQREEYIRETISILKDRLMAVDIKAEIAGRQKNLYSIYEKMRKQNVDLDEIYDVLAVRIIVDTVRDCYASLGTVHTLWKPIPGRFKDYIAMPKSNMYQSLHTTVVGPHGEPLEIQIRTHEMHRTSEYGIAAHWRYKEGNRSDKNFDEKLAWLRQLLEWQHDLRDAREFMESLKIDLFSDNVFVFTPKGEVIELPADSVPLDFAYRVHTEVGHRCVGAKINGKIVSLGYKLKNGDIVEILTSKSSGPSRDWLSLAQTSQAKSKIRQWFKKEQREENITKGKEALEREFKKHSLELELLKTEKLLEIGRRINLFTIEDIYAALGDGTLSPLTVVNRTREDIKLPITTDEAQQKIIELRPASKPAHSIEGILVKGIDNLLTRLSHCCNPVPGDPIIGYVTRGRGVSIHRLDCRNISYLEASEKSRLVEANWDLGFHFPFQVKLEITALDRAGLLNDVMTVLAELKKSANWVTARSRKDNQATIEMILELKNKEELEYLLGRFNRVKDVHQVRRTS